jgi:GDP-4-dehydro-6-deoxy-D-mannose reductase
MIEPMSNKRRVLITGATGFVGVHLKRAFIELKPSDFEIFGTAYPELPASDAEGLFFIDLRSENEVLRCVAELQPDWVIHLAAVSSVSKSWRMREETTEVNVLGTQNLLEAVRRKAPQARLLFVSSAEVYGATAAQADGLAEESPFRSASPYAYSKAAGEMMCAFYEKEEGIDIVVARPFLHTGPGQSADFVCSDWARQVVEIERGERPPVLKIGNLKVVRDLSDVRDVVKAYIRLLENGQRGEAYNVCSGKAVPLRKVLDILASQVSGGSSIPVEADPARGRDIDIPWLVGNNRKILAHTGWLPYTPIGITMSDLVNYWRQKITDRVPY